MKFDDFSWGETRTVAGGDKGLDHGATEGVFDASKIKMRRWREWERERRSNEYAVVELVVELELLVPKVLQQVRMEKEMCKTCLCPRLFGILLIMRN